MYNGFIKVAAAVPEVRLADCKRNINAIENMTAQAAAQGVEIVCFPELCLTGYSCQDLFQQQLLLENAETGLLSLMEFSRSFSIVMIVGLPFSHEGVLYNCAAIIQKGKIAGIVPKSYIPNYKEFYEERWFTSGLEIPRGMTVNFCGQTVPFGIDLIFEMSHCSFGVEICEDLWTQIPPSSYLTLQGAEMVFNLSASNEVVSKNAYLRSLILSQSARCISGYIYAGAGYGESTQDVVFGGLAYIAENGKMMAEGERFCMNEQLVIGEIDVAAMRASRRVNTDFPFNRANNTERYRRIELELDDYTSTNFVLSRTIDPLPFVPSDSRLNKRCEDIINIQSMALARRITHTKAKTVVVGISGGLDSTLALLVCVSAFDKLHKDRHGIVGITMPGFGTTDRTYTNAVNLMQQLGITMHEISIKEACLQHFRDINVNPDNHDVTYENSQARERTQILMDMANKLNGFVVGTGDLSELALGWATYNGDQMSMYSVNSSVPKTLVRHLVRWFAETHADDVSRATLLDIVDTPVSPELIPADEDGNIVQKTEDLVGPYELHDFFLYHTLRNGFRPKKIFYLAKQAFNGKDQRVSLYDSETICKWMTTFFRRFFAQQYKRSCMPDGPKVGSCALSPRGDWRMPSDAQSSAWIDECEEIEASLA